MSEKIYFAHPINTYDTDSEVSLLQKIVEAFPKHQIENPNQKKHQEGYAQWRKEKGNGMRYFSEVVLPECDICVFLPFRDGRWPAGVAKEVAWFLDRDFPVFRMDLSGDLTPVTVMPNDKVILTVEETRARIRDAEGNTLPY